MRESHAAERIRPLHAALGGLGLLAAAAMPACGSDDETCAGTSCDAGPVVIPLGLRCSDAAPEGAELAPAPPAYSGGTCPELAPGRNVILSGGVEREFLLVTPTDMQPGEQLPVIFLWHWLGASAQAFYDQADAQRAVDSQRFIAVIPESLRATSGVGELFNWPWGTTSTDERREQDFVFFDDMLSCVSEQLPANANCVASAGVSDGALWTSQLAQGRGEYLSSILVLSGGVDVTSVRGWTEAAHKMPALVLWGGATDVCIVVEFEPASQNLEVALDSQGHFVLECVHNCGHTTPPFEATAGAETQFAALWEFVDQHPYWLPDGASPYQETGVPDGMPEWCAVGVGNATARTGDGCNGSGC